MTERTEVADLRTLEKGDNVRITYKGNTTATFVFCSGAIGGEYAGTLDWRLFNASGRYWSIRARVSDDGAIVPDRGFKVYKEGNEMTNWKIVTDLRSLKAGDQVRFTYHGKPCGEFTIDSVPGGATVGTFYWYIDLVGGLRRGIGAQVVSDGAVAPLPDYKVEVLLPTEQTKSSRPIVRWSEAEHERAYKNSPELHKDVRSMAAFKRVAKSIAAMYGIPDKTTKG